MGRASRRKREAWHGTQGRDDPALMVLIETTRQHQPSFRGSKVEQRALSRSCGSCRECCTVMKVEDLPKAAHERCPFVRKKEGCAVYRDRPGQCKAWFCTWRMGYGPDESRPDKTRFVGSVAKTQNFVRVDMFMPHDDPEAVPLSVMQQCEELAEAGWLVRLMGRYDNHALGAVVDEMNEYASALEQIAERSEVINTKEKKLT